MANTASVVALLKGGVGNQLFAYAAARAAGLARVDDGWNIRLILDTSFYDYDGKYGMQFRLAEMGLSFDSSVRGIPRLVRGKVIRLVEKIGAVNWGGEVGVFLEKDPREFRPIKVTAGWNLISGYRQHTAYHTSGIRTILRQELEKHDNQLTRGDRPDQEDVCVHLRVLHHKHGNLFNPERWNEAVSGYYLNGLRRLEAIGGPVATCWVFGDHNHTKAQLASFLGDNGYTTKVKESRFKDDALEDFRLMRQFERMVIGDSTFAWWAGYIGRSIRHVVLPAEIYASRPGLVFGRSILL